MAGQKRAGLTVLLVLGGLLMAGALSAQDRPSSGDPVARPDARPVIRPEVRPEIGQSAVAPAPRVLPPPNAFGPAESGPLRGRPQATTQAPTPRGDGELCVTKYNDLNADGNRDAGEPALAGWTFIVERAFTIQWFITTGGNGRVCFDGPLTGGDYVYKVWEDVPAGWLNSKPGSGSAHAELAVNFNGDQDLELEFGNYQPARLQFTKSVISTAPGGGFPTTGLPNGQFQIKHNCVLGGSLTDGNTSLSAGQTGPAAGYSGTPIGALCTVMEALPQGNIAYENCASGSGNWEQPVISSTPFTVKGGVNETKVTNRFVCTLPQTGSVCAIKFNDLNGDQNKQANEPFLAGWTFTLSNGATAVSGANGRACWTAPVGNYTVTETLKPGWTSTTPGGANPTKPVNIVVGQTVLMFGNRELPGKVCIVKYNDLNGSGTRDGIEPVIVGWSFVLKTTGGIQIVIVTTAGAGGSVCRDLPAGTYRAEEVVQAGWTNTDPVGSFPQKTFTVTPGQTTNLVFGNRTTPPPLPGKVCIVKYNDLAGNGIRDGADPALLGWTFNLKTPGGTQVGSIMTAASGPTNCRDLPAGVYRAEEVVQAGWTNTDPVGSSPQKPFTVTSGQTTNLVFGNRITPAQPGEICVEKYNDLNANGMRDAGEPPLPGWTFTRSGGGMSTVPGVTNAAGRWCAGTLLPPGSYTITETMKPGWINTDPGGTTPVETAVVVSNQTTTVVFGNRQNALPAAFLTIAKTKLTAGSCHGAQPGANNCTFRFTITNIGGTTWNGPLTISDTVTLGGSSLPVSVVTAPSGWACSTGVQTPIVCSSGPVSLIAGATATYDLQLLLNAPLPSQKNCAVLTWGSQQTGPACVQIFP